MIPPRLIAGYRAFRRGRFARDQRKYEALAALGQRPEIMVIGCVDSRCAPETIFDAAPGELLVVRNVANIVPAYDPDRATQHGVSAAIEFGVQALAVRHIVVLGHAQCGGIQRFASDTEPLSEGDFIGRWMSQIAPAAARVQLRADDGSDERLRALELAAVGLSLENLMTFPWIAAGVGRGALELHGMHFGIATGELLVRDPQTGTFAPCRAPRDSRLAIRSTRPSRRWPRQARP
ncbi:MAG: carbonic anhydrase [Acidisphaera sp.]|nr:carbonic anhydrase [Acidisphaera sp.]MBV9813679.1 carbonic anhydrase [Acetobacteraceae bacterium]